MDTASDSSWHSRQQEERDPIVLLFRSMRGHGGGLRARGASTSGARTSESKVKRGMLDSALGATTPAQSIPYRCDDASTVSCLESGLRLERAHQVYGKQSGGVCARVATAGPVPACGRAHRYVDIVCRASRRAHDTHAGLPLSRVCVDCPVEPRSAVPRYRGERSEDDARRLGTLGAARDCAGSAHACTTT